MLTDRAWLQADWPISDKIVAGASTRFGGNSTAPALAENNVGLNVGDVPSVVQGNRQALARMIAGQNGSAIIEPVNVQWLHQVHGSDCIYVGKDSDLTAAPQADAMWTDQPGLALAIQSADCVPVVMTDSAGRLIGAAHGGWRGLVAGVLPKLVGCMPTQAGNLTAWVGPCIGKAYFEVGAEVWRPVERICADAVDPHPSDSGKRLVDLPLLAQRQLQACGVKAVFQSSLCSYTGAEFYSHRQATHERGPGAQTGRMATFICRMA